MYIYDRANMLAQEIKECSEYKVYTDAKAIVFADEGTKSLVKEYKQLQFTAQATLMSGKEIEPETMEKLQKLGEVLQFNPKVTEFFIAEHAFQTLISDIYRIIGEASEVGLDFLA